MAAFNFNNIPGLGVMAKNFFALLFHTTSGHDHDGVNSKAVTVGTPTALSVTNASVSNSAAIAYSKLGTMTSANILVGSAGNVATVTPVTGDVAITNGGVTSISSGVIVNDDINGSAAIAYSKLATSTDVNTSGQVVDLTLSGEVQGDIPYRNASNWVRLAAGTAGYALITAGAGSNPYWGVPSVGVASNLASSVTVDGGANDITLVTTAQTVGGVNLTIPDYANVDQTLCTLELAQTFTAAQTFPNTGLHVLDTNASHDLIIIPGSNLTADRNFTITTGDAARTLSMAGDITTAAALTQAGAFATTLTATAETNVTLPTTGTLATLAGTETLAAKTLTAPKIVTTGSICDAGGDEYIVFTEAATPVTYIGVTSGDTTVAPQVRGAGETNTGLLLAGTGTGNVTIGDGADITKLLSVELSGATTAKTTTFTVSQTDDRNITFPDATDTLVGKATTDTFTNKTFDCDATGNALSNVNATELDSITGNTFGVPLIHQYTLTNQGAAVNIFNANAPFKFKVIRAWSISTSADGGTWKLNNGALGAGTDLSAAVTVDADGGDLDEMVEDIASEANRTIAANGSLSIVPDAGGALDCVLYVECLRVD